MYARSPKPARLTLLFYAAFAFSVVQERYASVDFYSWAFGEAFQSALNGLILASFVVVTGGALIRHLRLRRFPWAHAIYAGGALLLAELIWRYGIYDLLGNDYKVAAIISDMAKPVVLGLGLAAIVSEHRLWQRAARPSSSSTPS